LKKFTVLIIDSDVEPIYKVGRDIWRANAEKYRVDIFFLRTSNEIEDDSTVISDDVIYSKHIDNIEDRLIDKTLKGFKHVLKTTDHHYILRANLSSFFDIGLLKNFIAELPRQNVYSGAIEQIELEMPDKVRRIINFCSGSGFLLSRDIASLVLERDKFCPHTFPDDVWMGLVLIDVNRIEFKRCNLTDVKQIDVATLIKINAKIRESQASNFFQYRIKNSGNLPREDLDMLAWTALVQHFSLNGQIISTNESPNSLEN